MNKLCNRVFIGIVALAMLALPALSAPTNNDTGEILTNASIIELQGLTLGDAVIIEKIKTSKCDFDTSINGLKQLKAANVSGAVIEAMVATKDVVSDNASSTVAGNPNDPNTPHADGIWLLQETNGLKTMMRVEFDHARPASSGSGSTWGMLIPFHPVAPKVESYVFLPGTQSDLQLSQRRPVFYLYVNETQFANQGEAMDVQNPKEVILTKFEIKKNERVLSISQGDALHGSSSNIDKAIQEFEWEKVADGIYKIVPKDDLADGEYAFSSAITGGYGQLFSFGIHGSSENAVSKVASP